MRRLWKGWKKIALKIGEFQISLIFSLLYFLVVLPVGVVVGLFSDYLNKKGEPAWGKMEKNASTFKKLREQ